MKLRAKSLFSEIVSGFSKIEWRGQFLYFKHFSNIELGESESLEIEIFDNARQKGLSTEEERIKTIIQNGLWTEAKERELRQERDYLDNRLTTKKNLLIQSQIDQVNKEIIETQTRITKLLSARAEIIGFTVEHTVSRRINEEHIKLAAYKNNLLQQRFFTDEEFNEDIEDDDLQQLIKLYNLKLDYINKNIKKLAISPFFQNLFYLSKEPGIYVFYGKPVVQLSIFQIDLYLYANFFANIIDPKNPPSQEMLDNPDLLIESNQKNSNLKGAMIERNGDLSGGSVIGATLEEMRAAGVEGKSVNFRKKLREGATELSSIDLANIFNTN